MINQTLVFWPMASMACLTFVVLILVPIFRISSSKKGLTSARDYRLGESDRVPEWVQLANRNYMNLLESPVLFYTICLIIFVTQSLDETLLRLCWAYVGFRIVHSVIHVSINKILLRLATFALSIGVLMALWGIVFIPKLMQ
jgi:hypothetical protein